MVASAYYNEGAVAPGPQETASPYAGFEHSMLIDRFYETEGDPDIGRELSVRLFAHAGLEGDPRVVPLIGRDGTQVQGSDGPLTLADYVNFAARHHIDALEGILSFLMMEPGQEDYVAVRATMLSRLGAGRR
ncbi:MAG TPA: hypothetical protein VJP80_02005 [Candidatus Saccharimonadales bacterium]|nr:hypothetical protein [Candidatus Saccharimonadales bacterium]